MALFRRSTDEAPAPTISPRRPHPGLLRRERRALCVSATSGSATSAASRSRCTAAAPGADDLLQERCAEVIGIDARLAEIDELLHGSEGTAAAAPAAPRCCAARTSARTAAGSSTSERRAARSTTRCSRPPRRAAEWRARGRRARRCRRRTTAARAAVLAREPEPALLPRVRAAPPASSTGRLAAPPPRLDRGASAGTRATSSGSRSPPLVVAVAARGASRSSCAASTPPRRPRPTSPRRCRPPRRRSLERPERPHASGRPGSTAGRSSSLSAPARTAGCKPLALAAARRRDGLPQVGVLDSSALREPPPRLLRRLQRRLRGARRRQPGARHRPCARLRRRLRRCESRPEIAAPRRQRLFGDAFVVEKENICNILANQVESSAGASRLGYGRLTRSLRPFSHSATEETRRTHGRADPANSALHVSILASDLSVDQGSDRPLRRPAHPARLPARGARRLRGDDGAARGRPALLRQARPDALSRTSGATSRSPCRRRSPGRSTRASRPRSSFIDEQIESGAFEGGIAHCHATTRKGKPCQRTPLPERDYCPSHQHLERSLASRPDRARSPLAAGRLSPCRPPSDKLGEPA